MFTTEEEWKAAYDAAFTALSTAVWQGDISFPCNADGSEPYLDVAKRVSRAIATAVIRSTPDDISDTVKVVHP